MNAKMDFRTVIERELERRIKQNPRYSLRAFSKALGVDPGNLSRCLNGRAAISFETAEKITAAMNLKSDERAMFFRSLSKIKKSIPKNPKHSKKARSAENTKFIELDLETFEAITDVHHYAILELTYLENFSSDPAWIAGELGISVMKVKLAIKRLIGAGLLIDNDGKLEKAIKPLLKTKPGITTSSALRRQQKQVLGLGIQAIENQPISSRCNVSMTMPIDESKIEYARQRITEFVDDLCRELSSGKKTKVYQMGASFFSLQHRES